MIHFSFDPSTTNRWLLTLVLIGYFILELVISGYILYLIIHGIPK